MYPVREISTGTPPICPLVTRKYRSDVDVGVGRRAQDLRRRRALQRQRRDLLGDVFDLDLRPAAFWRSHRRLGSAAVQRYACSPSRATVPSSMTLPCSSHHGVYQTWPTVIRCASRVMMRSTRRVASGPLTRYLKSGEMSISAAALRMALYSCS